MNISTQDALILLLDCVGMTRVKFFFFFKKRAAGVDFAGGNEGDLKNRSE